MAACWRRVKSIAPGKVRPDFPGGRYDPRPRGPRRLRAAHRAEGAPGPGVRAASPAGEFECEEQRAAERHGPAEQLGPPARHERGAAQPAAEPAL